MAGRPDAKGAPPSASRASVQGALLRTEIPALQKHDGSEVIAVYRHREAVVADLHDRVIQRIFRAGLVLQGGDVSDGALAAAVAELDAALCDIRSTKYGLQVQRPVGDVGMQAEPGTDTCPGGGDSGADPSMPFVVDSSGVVAVAGR